MGSEAVRWTRDEKRMAWICSDGRYVTDHQIADMPDPLARELVLQVLGEASQPTRSGESR